MPDNGKAPELAVRDAQAAAEGVPLAGRVEFMGSTFRLGEKVGLMPVLKFAHAASAGLDTGDMEGMAAMYAMIRDCIYGGEPCTCKTGTGQHRPGCGYDPGDWARFERAAMDGHADGDELMAVVEQAMEQIMARPTRARSGSSSPARSRSGRSRGRSSSPPGGSQEDMPEAFRKAFEAGDTVNVTDILQAR